MQLGTQLWRRISQVSPPPSKISEVLNRSCPSASHRFMSFPSFLLSCFLLFQPLATSLSTVDTLGKHKEKNVAMYVVSYSSGICANPSRLLVNVTKKNLSENPRTLLKGVS